MKRPETEQMFGPGPLFKDACERFASFAGGLGNLRGFLEGNSSRGKMELEEEEKTPEGVVIRHSLATSGSPPNDHVKAGSIIMSYSRDVILPDMALYLNEYQTYSVKTDLQQRHLANVIVHLDCRIKAPLKLPLALRQSAIGEPLSALIDQPILKHFACLASHKVADIIDIDLEDGIQVILDYAAEEQQLHQIGLAYEQGRPIIQETTS